MNPSDAYLLGTLYGIIIGVLAVNLAYNIFVKPKESKNNSPSKCPHGEPPHIACDRCDLAIKQDVTDLAKMFKLGEVMRKDMARTYPGALDDPLGEINPRELTRGIDITPGSASPSAATP